MLSGDCELLLSVSSGLWLNITSLKCSVLLQLLCKYSTTFLQYICVYLLLLFENLEQFTLRVMVWFNNKILRIIAFGRIQNASQNAQILCELISRTLYVLNYSLQNSEHVLLPYNEVLISFLLPQRLYHSKRKQPFC